MPRSKRATVVPLTKTGKKTKEQKGQLIERIQADADKFHYLWVFHTDNMRNNCMQYVRTQWAGSRICLGRNAVMRKALGDTVESEHRSGCSSIASLLEGDVGLLFTDEEPQVVTDWFGSYTKADFARAGNVATEDVTLPEGPVVMGDENAPHSIEPQLRKLGMPTTLKKGVPTLANPYTICKEGQKLSPDQAHLLKLFGKAMATFQIVPQRCLDLQQGKIVYDSESGSAGAGNAATGDIEEDDDDEVEE